MTRLSGRFVTAVGGTTSTNSKTTIYLTGGGFPNYFPRSSHRDKDAPAYIKNFGGACDGLYKCGLSPRIWRIISEKCTHLSYYSAQGRRLPDVAARAVVVGGETYHIGGTSAGSPVRHLQDKYVSCT